MSEHYRTNSAYRALVNAAVMVCRQRKVTAAHMSHVAAKEYPAITDVQQFQQDIENALKTVEVVRR